MKRNSILIAVVVSFLAMMLAPATGVAAADAKAGDAVYKAKCASCHAKDGGGDTTMGKKFNLRDLRGADVQKLTDVELHTIIAKGKEKMPAYEKKLSADELNNLVAYIRSIKK